MRCKTEDSQFLNLVCAIILVSMMIYLIVDSINHHMAVKEVDPGRGKVAEVQYETSAPKRYAIPKE